ncbi:unnamed protein product [Closterium sp. NIES-53]
MTTAVASLSFTLNSDASQCFFRDHTTLTPLLAPDLVALADPTLGPAVARSSTTLPCLAVPSGFLTGLYIPSLSRNLVGVGYLQDRGITVTFPAHRRTAICTDSSTGAVLATFTRESHLGLFVLHTPPPQVAVSGQVASSPPVAESGLVTVSLQVAVSGQVAVSRQVAVSSLVAASCSCWSLAHPTVLWHHRLGHPSLPRLRSMANHSLVSGLLRVFLSLPDSLAPPCIPCVAGRLRATPHSSSLRPATDLFHTLHLDVWGLAPMLRPERERYFLVVVDDYSRYTTVFPLAKKSGMTFTLIWWLLATEGTRGSRVRCLHFDRGGEFRSDVLVGFCGEQGIRQSWTLPESPQQNRVAERPHWLGHGHRPHIHDPCPCAPFSVAQRASLRCAPAKPPSTCLAARGFTNLSLDRQPSALPRQVTVDSVGVGAGGAATGSTRSGGARLRGAGAGGAGADGTSSGGAGAGGSGTGGASSGGAGAGGAGTGGASSEGAGAGGTGIRGTSYGGAGAGGAHTGGASFGGARAGGAGAVGAGTRETRARGSPTVSPTAPPHRHDTRFQALRQLECEEQEQLVRERQELQWLDHQQQQPSLLQTSRCPPRAWPSSPLADLRTVLFHSPPRRSPPVFVLPSPPALSLTVSSHPITNYYRDARPVVSRVLASLVTVPRASPSSVSALTAAVADFASTRRLDYATRVVAAPPPRPLSVGSESALGCDVLEDRHFELEFLEAASPSLCAMLLSLEGDPDALDIPTPCTYCTYVDVVPPPRAKIVDGMWLFKVKWPPGSPPVFKARYVARGFNQHEGVVFFQTFAPTPKMNTLRVLLHVAA